VEQRPDDGLREGVAPAAVYHRQPAGLKRGGESADGEEPPLSCSRGGDRLPACRIARW
jgi:hypothetical protein